MNRRRFLVTSLAGALVPPLGAEAQDAGKVRTIGFLSPSYTPTPEQIAQSSFRAELRELGWTVGENLAIEPAYREGRVPTLHCSHRAQAKSCARVLCAKAHAASTSDNSTTTTSRKTRE
jgi:hypothetical protein